MDRIWTLPPTVGVWALVHKAVLCHILKKNSWTLFLRKKKKIKKQHRVQESRKWKEDRTKGIFFAFRSNHGGSVTPQIYEKILTIHKGASRAHSVTEGFLTPISQLFKTLRNRFNNATTCPSWTARLQNNLWQDRSRNAFLKLSWKVD